MWHGTMPDSSLPAEVWESWKSADMTARPSGTACCAGRFGFQRDMRAISSLWEPESEDNLNVRALLDSTAEVVDRAKIYARWWRLWRADVRAGWVAFGRYKVSHCAG